MNILLLTPCRHPGVPSQTHAHIQKQFTLTIQCSYVKIHAQAPIIPHSQLNSPDGGRFRSLHLQVIRLLFHLKISEHKRDGVPWISQNGPLTLPAAAQASSTDTSADTGGVTAREIGTEDEPAGAPQGATTRVLRCQSPKREGVE